MKVLMIYLFLFGISVSCKTDEKPDLITGAASHIEYFGFTLIDTYWDDPTDTANKTNYADEIQGFSNLADMLVTQPTDAIAERVTTFQGYGLKTILHLNELFFEYTDTNSPSGTNYGLRADYMQRWIEFSNLNVTTLTEDSIGAFYIGEEPTWNGITFSELNEVTNFLKTYYPAIPILVVEAYPLLQDLQVPSQVDWIGFDRYFVKNPHRDAEFQNDWAVLKTKLTRSSQRIMMIMDSHYIESAHGNMVNIKLEEMKAVAESYYELAKNEEKVVGILGYFWPNGFDTTESIGARGMPQEVKDTYIRIGKEISGKQ